MSEPAVVPSKLAASTGMLRAMQSRQFRWYISGQGVSLLGTWVTKVATSWLVYELVRHRPDATEAAAAAMLGIVNFAGLFPTLVLAPIAGVFVDRHDRLRVMRLTQVAALLQSVALAALAISGTITIPLIIGLQVIQGIINAFDAPARQALTVDLVERREDLPNAIALNSSMFNGARLVGPMIAGVILARTNAGWCFTLDAISYLAVIGTLMTIRVPKRAAVKDRKSPLHELREGVTYAFGSAPIRTLLLLSATVSMLGMSMQVLLPIFSTRLQSGWTGPHAYGALMTAMGIGALCGTIYLATRKSVVGLGFVISITAGLLGASMVAFSFLTHLYPALIFATLAGGSMVCTMAGCNTILQTIVDDQMRGRLMAFFTMAVMGMAPFGSLLAGALSASVGASRSVLIAGCCCLLGALLFASRLPGLRPIVRKIYVAKGILPEVAAGIQSATDAATPSDAEFTTAENGFASRPSSG